MTATRALLHRLFESAVAAAQPANCLPHALPDVPAGGRILILAAGKAAGAMAETAERAYLEDRKIPANRLAGIAVTRRGYAGVNRLVEMVEAGHPVPDQIGLAATERVLALAAEAGARDLVLVLLSGGASANWIAPAGRVSLGDKQALTRALLASGADIGEINCVRKHLSRIKGGRLAGLAAPASLVTLAISDVPGDDPSVIGSGPTVPDPTTLGDAQDILRRRRIFVPPSIAGALADPGNETPKPGDRMFESAEYRIVARPAEALAAAARTAREAGYEPILLGAELQGEAQAVAAAQAKLAISIANERGRAVLLSGGELTVTLAGKGRGGPNQEFALALAIALDGAPRIAALAADTDGTDGGGGSPDDPAGAYIDESTLSRARALGLDPARFLAENDSTGFFERLGDLVIPGPTRTNVNDFRAIVIDS